MKSYELQQFANAEHPNSHEEIYKRLFVLEMNISN